MSIVRRKLPLVAIAALSVGACGDDGDGAEDTQSGPTLEEVQRKIRAFCIREADCEEQEEESGWTSGDSWSGSSSYAYGASKSKGRRAKLRSQAVNKGVSAVDACETRIQFLWGKKSDMSEECSEAVLDLLNCYTRLSCDMFFDDNPCPTYAPKARLCGWDE